LFLFGAKINNLATSSSKETYIKKVSTTTLQIASFTNQLKVLSLSQRKGIENMIKTVCHEAREDSSAFLDGVAFGSFLSWGIIKIENDMLNAFRQVALALDPLNCSRDLLALAEEELFTPRADAESIIPDLKRARDIITRRLRVLERIEKSLLCLKDEEISHLYSEKTLQGFQKAWDDSLEGLIK
jgi:hypothetical protein